MSTPPPLEVVAAVLERDGKVLVARRPEGKADAGLWEFPGGKREAGESPQDALRRELHEELGIAVGASMPLIRVPVQRPTGLLWLDTYRVAAWVGEAQPLEHSTLAWVAPADLHEWPMPPADRPVVSALTEPASYVITPDLAGTLPAFLDALGSVLAGGAKRIQLRLPGLSSAARRQAVETVLVRFGREVNWLVNGDIELANHLGIGLHLTATQLRAAEGVPPSLAGGQLLAASCHDANELRLAEDLGCHFAALGAVLATPTHPGQRGMGWERFGHARAAVTLPVYALGGVGPADLATARQHGAQGVAGIRAWWPQPVAASAR